MNTYNIKCVEGKFWELTIDAVSVDYFVDYDSLDVKCNVKVEYHLHPNEPGYCLNFRGLDLEDDNTVINTITTIVSKQLNQ